MARFSGQCFRMKVAVCQELQAFTLFFSVLWAKSRDFLSCVDFCGCLIYPLWVLKFTGVI